MPKASRRSGPHDQDTCSLALSWMFKLILDCGGHQNFINSSYLDDDGIARELGIFGLEKLRKAADSEGPVSKPSFRERALAALHQERKLFADGKIQLQAWVSEGLTRLLQEAPISSDMQLIKNAKAQYWQLP